MKTRIYLAAALSSLVALPELYAVMTITRHPTNQWVSLGAHVTNAVLASSTAPPITYQWYGKGALLPDETNSILVLTNILLAQAGEYYVVVNDTHNVPLQSNIATISVDPKFIKINEGSIVTDREPSFSSTWWDYDGDGWLDLYVVNNACSAGCPARNSLYHNLGNGTFERITNILSTRLVRYSTAAVADYDHDLDQDIYVLGNTYSGYGYPPDELYRNDGGAAFAPVTSQPWASDLDHSNDCGWADYDRDGLLDIFTANVVELECLYRQTGDGSFVKMSAVEVGTIVGVNLSSDALAWADYDNDGDPDLWVSSRDGLRRLHQNNGRGYFSAATNAGSVTIVPANAIGVWGDYDNDGWLDLFTVASPWAPVTTAIHALHRNLQGMSFTNMASAAGAALANNAWASAWGDYDNDGWLDLFVANFENGTNLFYHNLGNGTFEKLELGSPIRDGNFRATVAWVDYGNDGFLDLFITCGNGTSLPNHLYRNNAQAIGNTNHWLKVKLIGTRSNGSAIGAKVRVQATSASKWQMREISGNSGYQGGYGLVAHFGLGNAIRATTIRVEWPSGTVEEFANVSADQVLTLVEPSLRGAMLPNGAFELIATASTNRVCQLDYSSDLVNWSSLTNFTGQGETPVTVTDPDAPSQTQRFYRMK
jgi:hypothetical protein